MTLFVYTSVWSLALRRDGSGVQVGTIDALLAQLCIRHDLTLLGTDDVIELAVPLRALWVWAPKIAAPRK